MAENIEYYIQKLKKNKIRMTSQRRSILEYLAIEDNHPTANEIYQSLSPNFPKMSIATIYNNLTFFKEAGILQELPFGDGSSRYDLSETRHYHAVCAICGRVEDFHYSGLENIEKHVSSEIGFKVEEHNFKVTGVCKKCR